MGANDGRSLTIIKHFFLYNKKHEYSTKFIFYSIYKMKKSDILAKEAKLGYRDIKARRTFNELLAHQNLKGGAKKNSQRRTDAAVKHTFTMLFENTYDDLELILRRSAGIHDANSYGNSKGLKPKNLFVLGLPQNHGNTELSISESNDELSLVNDRLEKYLEERKNRIFEGTEKEMKRAMIESLGWLPYRDKTLLVLYIMKINIQQRLRWLKLSENLTKA